MTTTQQVDRMRGLVGSLGMKAPCRVATTANIALSGTQTIDGVAVVAGDRVLVKAQTTSSENGIYVCDAGAWDRAPDFDGDRDVVKGTQIRVNEGTLGVGTTFAVVGTEPILPGTSAITFTAVAGTITTVFDTSATSNTIGTGAKTFAVSSGKSFVPGMYLVIADSAAPSTNSMVAQVTSYTGTSLVVNVLYVRGSGTIAAWTISFAGAIPDLASPPPIGTAVPNTAVFSRVDIGHATAAQEMFYVSGAAADKKRADFVNTGAGFFGRFVNDAQTLVKNWLEVIGNYVDGPTSITFPTLVKTTGGAQITGNPALNLTIDNIRLGGTGTGVAAVGHIDSTRTANNRLHDIVWASGNFQFQFVNDVYGAATPWLTVGGGYAAGVTSVTMTAPVINLVGSAVINNAPGTKWGLDFAPGTGNGNHITLAADATFDLAAGSGLVALHSNSGASAGSMALLATEGGFTTKIFDRSGNFAVALDTAGKINLYYNAGTVKYRIQNKTGASVTMFVCTIKTREVS